MYKCRYSVVLGIGKNGEEGGVRLITNRINIHDCLGLRYTVLLLQY